MNEQAIQFKIRNYLKNKGWLVNKLMSVSEAGTPDLIAHKDGDTIYVEVKRPGGRLRKVQEYRIAQLRSAGITVYIEDNLENFKYLIEKHYRYHEEVKNEME